MITVKSKNLKILLVFLLVTCFCFCVYLEYIEFFSDGDWFWCFLMAEILFDDEIFSFRKQRKRNAFYINALRGNKMLEESLNGLLGKKVEIRTLDDSVSGVVKSIDGDFLVLEKDRKNAVETFYVNKNTVQTVKTVKQK